MELLVLLLVFAIVLTVLLVYVVPIFPAPFQVWARVIVIVCAAVWFITHLTRIIHGVLRLFP